MSTSGCKRFIVLLLGGSLWSLPAFSGDSHEDVVSRGRYLVEIAGCNDCHTAGFAPSGGAVPVQEWLQGDVLGFRGPWGTTYPSNLRKFFGNLSEEQWVSHAKEMKTRPPMPWWAVNAMSRDDLVAVYRFVKTLGPSDTTVPATVPPGEPVSPPFIQWPESPE